MKNTTLLNMTRVSLYSSTRRVNRAERVDFHPHTTPQRPGTWSRYIRSASPHSSVHNTMRKLNMIHNDIPTTSKLNLSWTAEHQTADPGICVAIQKHSKVTIALTETMVWRSMLWLGYKMWKETSKDITSSPRYVYSGHPEVSGWQTHLTCPDRMHLVKRNQTASENLKYVAEIINTDEHKW